MRKRHFRISEPRSQKPSPVYRLRRAQQLSFAEGAAFPKVCVNVRCLDNVDVDSLTLTPFNGKDL